jgi:hypothetical protein
LPFSEFEIRAEAARVGMDSSVLIADANFGRPKSISLIVALVLSELGLANQDVPNS